MRSLVLLACFFGMSMAAPQFLVDTPEVSAAKQQFQFEFNQAASQSVADPDSPAAVPYIHEEIPAEPYIHQEVPAEPYIHQEPADNSLEGGHQASSGASQVIAYNNAGALAGAGAQVGAGSSSPSVYSGICYNVNGEVVPCRF